jgi:hypothetical protein
MRDYIALEKKVLEADFKLFVRDAWQHIDGDEFLPNWHIDAICEHLQKVYEGKCKRLLINMPPGMAKSLLVSVLYNAWVWTTKPEHKFLSTSYSLDLSQRDSRKLRQLVLSDWYQARWPIRLKADQNEKVNFENVSGGSRVAKPFNSLTGARGNTVIVDDPHSVHLAWSDTERGATVQTFKAAVPTRLHNPKRDSIIVVMQRLHEEDVSGFILDHPELGYTHLCIPMQFEGDKEPNLLGYIDPRNEEGELLFPDLIDDQKVAELRASLGPTDYAGQHQQRPTPRENGEIDVSLFKRFDLRDAEGKQGWPRGCNYYMTSDHAVSQHSKSDFNVFRVWAIDHRRNLWLVDSFRKQCSLQEALGVTSIDGKTAIADRGALAMIRKWKPLAFFPEADNNFKAVEGFFRTAMRDTATFVKIDPVTPHGKNKIAKAQGYVNQAHQGRVHIPKTAWGDLALAEYASFPNGKHDDQVDADGMIGRVIDKLVPGYLPLPEEEVERLKDYRPSDSNKQSSADSFFI